MRITNRDLEILVDRINEATGSPKTSYTRYPDKNITANIGNYLLDRAYGGWKLVRMETEGGGISEVTKSGYTSKRESYIMKCTLSYQALKWLI